MVTVATVHALALKIHVVVEIVVVLVIGLEEGGQDVRDRSSSTGVGIAGPAIVTIAACP